MAVPNLNRHPGAGRGPAGGRASISRVARHWTPAFAGVTRLMWGDGVAIKEGTV